MIDSATLAAALQAQRLDKNPRHWTQCPMIANFSKQHGQQDFSVMKIHDQAMGMPVIWLDLSKQHRQQDFWVIKIHDQPIVVPIISQTASPTYTCTHFLEFCCTICYFCLFFPGLSLLPSF